MPAKSRDPLQKKTLNLREGDWEFIESIFKPQDVDTSLIVRTLVSDYVDRIKQTDKSELPETSNINL